MNDLTLPPSGPITMTSREISDLTEKDHRHVLRDIEVMLKELKTPLDRYAQNWTHPQNGQEYRQFVLPAREVKILVTGYSISLRARVIDRLEELEAKVARFDPAAVLADPAAMRGLLLTYTEKVLALEEVVAGQAPKVEALKRIEDAEGALGIREAAQVLQVPERKLTRHLDAEGWIFKMHGSRRWQGYSEKRKAGLLTHKVRRYQRDDGEWCESEAVRITPKGIAKLAEKFSVESDLFSGAPA